MCLGAQVREARAGCGGRGLCLVQGPRAGGEFSSAAGIALFQSVIIFGARRA